MTLFACGQKGTSETTVPVTEVKKAPATTAPLFDADSAYAYVEKQVSFGYRVPNTPAHKACGDYLASELKRFGDTSIRTGSYTYSLQWNPIGIT